jgi:parvulin-like peptidyl-prolyl isomerase
VRRTIYFLLAACALVAPTDVFGQVEYNWPQTFQKTPLAYIDDTILTVGDLARHLEGSGTAPTGVRDQDIDSLQGCLDALIDQNIVTLDMDTAAILARENGSQRARWRMAYVAGPVVFVRYVKPLVHVSDSAANQFYRDSLKTMFTAPPQREIRHLLVAPKWHTEGGKRVQRPADVAQAKTTAESLLTTIRAGAAFDSLAGALSDDTASRGRNGYLGWVFPGNTVYDFDTAAFHARLGEVTGPVKTMYGYHLIRVEGEKPESTIVLTDSLARLIRSQLEFIEGKRLGTIWADSVLEAAQWRFNDPILGDTMRTPDDSVWVVVVNERDTMWCGEWKGAWILYQRSDGIEGKGTVDDMHKSLKKSAFPYLYLHAAEQGGFADEPPVSTERWNFLRSEAMRYANQRLSDLQAVPDSVLRSVRSLAPSAVDKPLHVQMIHARDSASIWSAYKKLVAGNNMATVAKWYNADMRQARAGSWDLGWIGKGDLPDNLFGAVWILGAGQYTRPIETDSGYYILRLAERAKLESADDLRYRSEGQATAQYREQGAAAWRKQIRKNHSVRINQSAWQRLVQIWRK